VSGSYVAPIHGTPLTAVVYGVHSNSNVSAINNIGVIGSGDIGGVRAIYSTTSGNPLSPLVHQFTFGADYKSFKEDLNLTGSDTAKTPISYVPFTLQYSVAKRSEKQEIDFGISLNFGLRGVGASDAEFRLKRFEASANWAALRGDFSYLRKWHGDWQTGLRTSWQFSGRPMVSNEQFSLGGLDSVRGYFESQVLGDDGASGQLQLDAPSLHKIFGEHMQSLRLFTFVDGGVMRVHKPLGEQDRSTRLISVGGGLTLRSFNMLNLSALLAAPLINRGDAPSDLGDLRAQLRLWLDF
jgi:hemolysin activation/secretion protein